MKDGGIASPIFQRRARLLVLTRWAAAVIQATQDETKSETRPTKGRLGGSDRNQQRQAGEGLQAAGEDRHQGRPRPVRRIMILDVVRTSGSEIGALVVARVGMAQS